MDQRSLSAHPHGARRIVHLYCLLADHVQLLKSVRVLWIRDVTDVLQKGRG